ncbi:hypothetical protein CPAR01_10255 [Colletotrichum paranaense]|uniref:Uncharacterized protein n=1 Tax=Colletotrichum paranaense TaxID=1914294 RepID=A0ABQ9SDH6_9PEZI|nr:uncharacterized protein CPAR01_10255 [Colletotrichum paranaense]KAK1533547.1 hypothetical protein CPAR01_10255 [Colletotrichum paranaense]
MYGYVHQAGYLLVGRYSSSSSASKTTRVSLVLGVRAANQRAQHPSSIDSVLDYRDTLVSISESVLEWDEATMFHGVHSDDPSPLSTVSVRTGSYPYLCLHISVWPR